MRQEFCHKDMSFISSPDENELKCIGFNKDYDKLIYFAGVGSSAASVFNAFVLYENNNESYIFTFISSSQNYKMESSGYHKASEDYFWDILRKHNKDNFFKNVHNKLLHMRLENELSNPNDIKIKKIKI